MALVLGVAFGWGMSKAFREGWTPEYLKAPDPGLDRLCYAVAELIEKEIGLVAVTAYGMTLANSKLAGLTELQKFKEDIAVLSGLRRVRDADRRSDAGDYQPGDQLEHARLPAVHVVHVVRPLSVWISTYGTLNRKEAILLGWIAPRGIVAVAVSGLFGSLAGRSVARRAILLRRR